MAARLSNAEIQSHLAGLGCRLGEWELRGKEISRAFTFKDFVEAIAFVNRIAKYAEESAHHPDISISWNKVTLSVTTHDAGGLTEKDFALAANANAQAGSMA